MAQAAVAVKRRKNTRIYLLVMPKYWGKQIFTHGSFPEVGQKQKTERKRKKERRAKVGNNNGQLRIATPTRVAHLGLLGQFE